MAIRKELTAEDYIRIYGTLISLPVHSEELKPRTKLYPSRKRLSNRNTIIGIIGTPESGKTEVFNHLRTVLTNQASVVVALFTQEFGSQEEYQTIKRTVNTIENPNQGGWAYFYALTSMLGLHKGYLHFINLWRQQLISEVNGQDSKPIVWLIERDWNDRLAVEASFIHLEREKSFPQKNIPSHLTNAPEGNFWQEHSFFPNFNERLRISLECMIEADVVDALLLTTTSLAEASARRLARGKPPHEGHVTPEMWPFWNMGYAWYQEHFFPWLRKHSGTGILAFNESVSLQTLKTEATNYILKIVQTKNPSLHLSSNQ